MIMIASPPKNEKPGLRETEASRLFALAVERHRHGNLEDAVRGYVRALALDPKAADVYNNLGVALRAQGKGEAAVACYKRSLALRPGDAGAYSNMGNALCELGRLAEAEESLLKALELTPDLPGLHYNLGLVLRNKGQSEDSLACFDRALELNPNFVDCRWDRALGLLRRGDYGRGFNEYEWRMKLLESPIRRFPQPLWDGGALGGGAILLHQEQGYGDMIQFSRYAALVKKRGGPDCTVLLECEPALVRLLSSAQGVDKAVIAGSDLPAFDAYAPLLSLPKILAPDLNYIPNNTPYLHAPELHNMHLPMPLESGLKVGFAWAGKPSHKNDAKRSVDFERFLDLMGAPEISFFSLQKGAAAEGLTGKGCAALCADIGGRCQDFADTACALEQLDLVVTVDTALAHLAGALGIPVWVLLPYVADWRWLEGRDDSPWYPSARLFRQGRPGDWDGVFDDVAQALREKLEETRNRGREVSRLGDR